MGLNKPKNHFTLLSLWTLMMSITAGSLLWPWKPLSESRLCHLRIRDFSRIPIGDRLRWKSTIVIWYLESPLAKYGFNLIKFQKLSVSWYSTFKLPPRILVSVRIKKSRVDSEAHAYILEWYSTSSIYILYVCSINVKINHKSGSVPPNLYILGHLSKKYFGRIHFVSGCRKFQIWTRWKKSEDKNVLSTYVFSSFLYSFALQMLFLCLF